MTTKRHRDDRLAFTAIPTAIIQQIALYIPDSKDFFSYLSCFQNAQGGETLGELGHFLELSTKLEPTDLWPKLQLRLLTPSLVPSVRCITRFFTTIYVFEVFDVTLLQQCLHPHNVVELLECPPRDLVHQWLAAPVSMLPVKHITFTSQDPDACDLFLDQLPCMSGLASLSFRNSVVRGFGRLFAFIQASSTLTRLHLSMIYLSNLIERVHRFQRVFMDVERIRSPAQFQRQHLEILGEWLRRCPATSIDLKRWDIDFDDETCVANLLDAIFTSSSLENVVVSNPRLGVHIAQVTFPAPLRLQSLDLSSSNIDGTAMASLVTGLRDSSLTSLSLEENDIGVKGLQSLLDVLPLSNIQKLRLRRVYLDDSACKMIATALPSSKLVDLDLSVNRLTDRSANELSKVVARATSLTTLNLFDNEITPQGATALVKALNGRSQVTTWLDLGGNFIEGVEVQYLNAMVLKTSQILTANFRG
ncbi:hypothetical protein LEN26_005594 [Aphanomyces euteiches]|nr:hypothetical protein LEN26_005594 [Aphanomyces euteiches]